MGSSGAVHWITGYLPMAALPKETDSPLCSSIKGQGSSAWGGLQELSPLRWHAGWLDLAQAAGTGVQKAAFHSTGLHLP